MVFTQSLWAYGSNALGQHFSIARTGIINGTRKFGNGTKMEVVSTILFSVKNDRMSIVEFVSSSRAFYFLCYSCLGKKVVDTD